MDRAGARGMAGLALARPLVLCGQASLPVFCLGTVLSVLGYATRTELGRGLDVEAPVVAVGLLAMIALAHLLASVERLRRETRPPLRATGGGRGTQAATSASLASVI